MVVPKFTTVLNLFLLLSVLRTVSVKTICGRLKDCPKDADYVCALDKNEVCFSRFPSECHMKVDACQKEKEYLNYHDSYCDLAPFLCDRDYSAFTENWFENENLDEIIYSIYKEGENNVGVEAPAALEHVRVTKDTKQ